MSQNIFMSHQNCQKPLLKEQDHRNAAVNLGRVVREVKFKYNYELAAFLSKSIPGLILVKTIYLVTN